MELRANIKFFLDLGIDKFLLKIICLKLEFMNDIIFVKMFVEI